MLLVRTGGLDGYERFVRSLGGNPVALLRQAGLNSAQLRDPNNFIPFSKKAEILEITAQALDEPFFGLSLATQQNSSILGEMATPLFLQPTLLDALNNLSKYLYLHANGVRLEQETSGEDTLLNLIMDLTSAQGPFQTLQLGCAQLGNIISDLLNLQKPGYHVLLRQSQPDYARTRFDSASLGRIRFDSHIDGISFPTAWLAYKPCSNNAALLDHFHQHLDSLEDQYSSSLVDQVRGIIGQLLQSGDCSIENVSATLGIHQRVLQSRLRDLDTSYGSILQQTRRENAEQYLRFKSLTITELAYMCGYADVSVFSRSFKRWTGLSPKEWQHKHLNGGNARTL